jgi:excinuclease ABC subunit A
MERIKRLVRVDKRPIGRTPRSNLATYTGLFDAVRKPFAATKGARAKRYVMVELLFLASVYAPCPTCHGARYSADTLKITYRGKTIPALRWRRAPFVGRGRLGHDSCDGVP